MKSGLLYRTVVALVTLSLVLSVSFLVGCEGSKPATGEPIKIGCSLPQTGVFAATAKDVKIGYEFWAEETNSKGGLLGRPIELIVYDDTSDPARAATNYERLITVDKVDLLLGGYPGTANVATMPLAEKYGMVFVGMGGHLAAMEQGFKYSFASPPLIGEWCGLAYCGPLEEIPEKERPKTVAIMTMNNVIGKAVRDGFLQESSKYGLEIVMNEVYSLPLADATTLVAKAKEKNADILFACGAFADGAMTIRTAKSLRYQPKLIFQCVGCTSPAWISELGKDGHYVVGPLFWNPNLPFSYCAELREAGNEIYAGADIPVFFGYGYSWGKTLQLAVEGAGSLDQNKIRQYLATKSFDLPYGNNIAFDERGLPPKYIFSSQALNGKIELVWPNNVATAKFVYPHPGWE